MRTKIYVVLVASVIALLSAGGDGANSSSSSSDNQRYAMFSPQVENGGVREVYVIDTVTGRVWRQMFFEKGIKGLYLFPQPYITADQSAVSATPPVGVMSESSSLQRLYEQEVQRAQQKAKEPLNQNDAAKKAAQDHPNNP